MTDPTREIDRIREVYRERDRRAGRGPAIGEAYRLVNEERLARMDGLIRATVDIDRARLLDVGCGAGLDLAYWLAAGWTADRLAGVDLAAERINRARLACPGVDLQVTDGAELPFPDASFDVATAVTVFSSILDPALQRALFAEMRRVVRPGGLLVIYDFVVRKPTNPDVRGVGLRRLREVGGRAPDGSTRLTPLLYLVAAGAAVGPLPSALAMRFAPRTHRLSYWRVRPPATSDR